ncbi:MAG: hypothetical protein LUH56_06445, partial [Oscillospiraceae bacterium]|nr:hypothetical protein [Oscillospiraceae bacterium]
MSDKNLSVEDILEEYSNKTTGKTSAKASEDTFDLDAILNGTSKSTPTKTEVIEDVLEVGDNSFVFDPSMLDEAVASSSAPVPSAPTPSVHYPEPEPEPEPEPAVEAATIDIDSLLPESHDSASENLADDLDLRHGGETVQGTVEMEKALEKANIQSKPEPEPVAPAPEPTPEPEPEPVQKTAKTSSSS